jgi:hypothetical protein
VIGRERERVSWTRPTRKMEATEAAAGVSFIPGNLKYFCACFFFPKSEASDRKYAERINKGWRKRPQEGR